MLKPFVTCRSDPEGSADSLTSAASSIQLTKGVAGVETNISAETKGSMVEKTQQTVESLSGTAPVTTGECPELRHTFM